MKINYIFADNVCILSIQLKRPSFENLVFFDCKIKILNTYYIKHQKSYVSLSNHNIKITQNQSMGKKKTMALCLSIGKNKWLQYVLLISLTE